MAYCSQSDLILRFGERELILRTDRKQTSSVDTEVLAKAIADADAVIDGYLQDGGYSVPLATTPSVLARYSCDLARYFLYDDFRPDVVQRGYDRALTWLERVATGQVKLEGETRDTSDNPKAVAVASRTMTYDDDWEETYTQ